MKGTVDSWSVSAGTGVILGEDGENYAFAKSEVIEAEPTLPGAEVSFTASLAASQPQATAIKVLRGVAITSATCAAGGVVVTDIRLPFFSVVRLVFQIAVVSFLLWLASVAVIVSLRMF